jgi:hypothetical protein
LAAATRIFGLVLCNLLFDHALLIHAQKYFMYKILRIAIWLLPLYIGYQLGYQINVLFGMSATYTQGESILAKVEDFRIKQIAAQTNGYIVLDFITANGTHVNRLLSLPVQMAAPLMNFAIVDIKYLEGSTQEIVITATYDVHKNMIIVNIAVLTLSLMIVTMIAVWATRFANRKIQLPDEPVFTRVDIAGSVGYGTVSTDDFGIKSGHQNT